MDFIMRKVYADFSIFHWIKNLKKLRYSYFLQFFRFSDYYSLLSDFANFRASSRALRTMEIFSGVALTPMTPIRYNFPSVGPRPPAISKLDLKSRQKNKFPPEKSIDQLINQLINQLIEINYSLLLEASSDDYSSIHPLGHVKCGDSAQAILRILDKKFQAHFAQSLLQEVSSYLVFSPRVLQTLFHQLGQRLAQPIHQC